MTVYWTLPQPVAGVEALTDDQVPAKVSIPTVGDGDVGVEDEESFLSSLSSSEQLVATRQAQATARKGQNSPH